MTRDNGCATDDYGPTEFAIHRPVRGGELGGLVELARPVAGAQISFQSERPSGDDHGNQYTSGKRPSIWK